jgi:flagellar hook-basal body complex protein FliE
MNGIQGIRLTPPAVPAVPAMPGAGDAQPQTAFKDFLLESLGQVNTMQLDANSAVQNLMTGGDVNPAEVLTTVQKADLAFRMMLQIRNKLVQAYQDVKDIRV